MSSKDFFGENTEEWNWKDFETTEGFPVSEDLLDWIIGQEKAMEECRLCIDDWMHKLKGLKKHKWWRFWEKRDSEKPSAKNQLSPAPSLFLLGDAGTGKSLMGRALASHLTFLYKKYKIPLYDVICWRNEVIPSEPKISISPSPEGRILVRKLLAKEQRKGFWKKWGFRILQGGMIGFGVLIIGFILFHLVNNWLFPTPNLYYTSYGVPVFPESQSSLDSLFTFGEYWTNNGGFVPYILNGLVSNAQLLYLGIGSLSMGAMIFIFKNLFGMAGGNKKGIGGAISANSPKLIVDNSDGKAPFIDATGHGSSQLFGSIAWDPYQTGGLGTPEHQRVSAGEVHRAFMGILYIDEIKNLSQKEAVTLLTVLEDGQLPITLRSSGSISGDTAAMSVATEPVPCLNFLVAAGNFDSIPHIHPALMDRIYGYGKVVRMNNEMQNNVENRRKYIQFISQEVKRFDLLPFSREACMEIISEGRRKSGFRNKLTTRFRPMISIIKTSAILAINEGKEYVDSTHVKEAIENHCKTIHRQLLEYWINNGKPFIYIDPKAKPRMGQIAGLAVRSFAEDDVGEVTMIKASMNKVPKAMRGKTDAYFNVSGVAKPDKSEWVHDSIAKVRHVIIEKYGVDPAVDYKTMIDFQQEYGIDGPSAGITMTLALISVLKKKKIRQDIAVTGEITIDCEGNYIITPIGGVDAKIRAAEYWGYTEVVIPMKNFYNSIDPKDYRIKVVGCETLDDYMKECFVD